MDKLKALWQKVLDADERLLERLDELQEKYGIPEEEMEELQHLHKVAENAQGNYWVALNKEMSWYQRLWYLIKAQPRRVKYFLTKSQSLGS